MTEAEWEQLVPEPLDGMELPEDLTVEDGESIGTDTGVVGQKQVWKEAESNKAESEGGEET